jgi:hypothetical protein
MLEQLDASHFSALTGKVCDLHLQDGSILQVMVDSVSTKPQARNPYAPTTQRMPFSVTLTAVGPTAFAEGPCAIDLETFGRADGIYVSRVAALGRDPNGAYYQIIFN